MFINFSPPLSTQMQIVSFVLLEMFSYSQKLMSFSLITSAMKKLFSGVMYEALNAFFVAMASNVHVCFLFELPSLSNYLG